MKDPVRSCSGGSGSRAAANAGSSDEQVIEGRYLRCLDELMSDAVDHRRLDTLANVLAWTIARIAIGCGPAATGDVLRRIGGHLCKLETLRQTEAEAKRAREEGRIPN